MKDKFDIFQMDFSDFILKRIGTHINDLRSDDAYYLRLVETRIRLLEKKSISNEDYKILIKIDQDIRAIENPYLYIKGIKDHKYLNNSLDSKKLYNNGPEGPT